MREAPVRSEVVRPRGNPERHTGGFHLPTVANRWAERRWEQEELDAALHDLERKLPDFAKPLTRLIRNPPRPAVRVLFGSALIVGGIFSFLPVLGVWMLPLGLLLLARDVPAVARLSTRMLRWVERKLPSRS